MCNQKKHNFRIIVRSFQIQIKKILMTISTATLATKALIAMEMAFRTTKIIVHYWPTLISLTPTVSQISISLVIKWFQFFVIDDDVGDVCDPDIDGDGIRNENDNCRLVSNPDQEDENHDGIGDICQDIDLTGNFIDNCPNNTRVFRTDFRHYQAISLDPEGESQFEPKWVIYDKGSEIVQLINSDPGVVVGKDAYGGLDFEGSVFVDTDNDDDYIGFVFSFQSNQKFYTVMWKKANQTYREELPFKAVAGK